MKITKVQHHGQIRYRVNVPNGEGGKRQRKFFETKEAAEDFARERTTETKQFGVHCATAFLGALCDTIYHLGSCRPSQADLQIELLDHRHHCLRVSLRIVNRVMCVLGDSEVFEILGRVANQSLVERAEVG